MLPRRCPASPRSPSISARASPALQLRRLLVTQPDSPPIFRSSSAATVLTLADVQHYHRLPQEFTHVLDARSPGEFAEDRIPFARNAPVLSDQERVEVGTLHKRDVFSARLRGAALISANIARMLPELALSPKSKVLVYCWRGGERSKSLAHVISRIGCQTSVLAHGYKTYRAMVRSFLHNPIPHTFFVVGGLTGVGKSRVLHALKASGEQVLDLEHVGKHRGSAFGAEPGIEQPTQPLFETHIFHALSGFDPKRPVFVESESSKVGRLAVPPLVWDKMKTCALRFEVPAPMHVRVRNIRQEYSTYESDAALLNSTLDKLVPIHGHALVDAWRALSAGGKWDALVQELLVRHYDPAYTKSAKKSYNATVQETPPLLGTAEAMTEVTTHLRRTASARMNSPV